MTKGSNGSGNSASKTVATFGCRSAVPVKTTVSFKGSGGGEGSYQTKSQISYGDKKSGSYGRATTTEKASAGEFQWKNGTSGTRSEYKQSSTFRFGDKGGYTEVYREQKFRNVSYDKSTSSGTNYLTYNNDDSDDDDDDGPCGGGDDRDDDGSSDGSEYDDDDDDGSSSDGEDGGVSYHRVGFVCRG